MRSREPAPETIFPGLSLTAAIPAGFPGAKMKKMLQSKLFGYVYDLDEDGDKSRTLKQGDNYTIQH